MGSRRLAALSIAAFSETLCFSEHYYRMLYKRPTPSEEEIKFLLWDDEPEVIEDYPQDPLDSSCLIVGTTDGNGRIGHVVCADPPQSKIITAYFPAETYPDKWNDDY